MDGEGEEDVIEAPEVEADETGENDNQDEVLTVQIGDEEPEEDDAAKAPEWVKDLRKKSREDAKRIRDLEAAIAERDKKPDALGPKPTLESCDYDEGKFETELDTWKAAKAESDTAEQSARDAQTQADERWQTKLSRMQERKAELKLPDFDDAEDFVRETFSIVQQGILVQGADDAALLAYALGKNPKKAKELAALTDPIEFAFAIAKTEAQLKVGTRNVVPAPERDLKGRGGTNAITDNKLTQLEAKADKTGDRTEVVAYKRLLREREKARA